MSSLTAANKDKIAANRKAIFELEGDVNYNKARGYLTRSLVAENTSLILKNYNSAFLGNRQLANANTDCIFRNRVALLQCLPASTDVEINFREAMINKAKLTFLKHRSQLNSQLLSISQDMAAVNAQMISVNRRIMETNETIKDFNSTLIAETADLIGAQHNPTPESNAAIIAANAADIVEVTQRVHNNNASVEELSATIEANRISIMANSQLIAERREAILKNHDLITANRKRIAAVIGARR